jgi:hypothetical protein
MFAKRLASPHQPGRAGSLGGNDILDTPGLVGFAGPGWPSIDLSVPMVAVAEEANRRLPPFGSYGPPVTASKPAVFDLDNRRSGARERLHGPMLEDLSPHRPVPDKIAAYIERAENLLQCRT